MNNLNRALVCFLTVASLFLTAVATNAAEAISDIRYRSIIYFYPGTPKADIAVVEKYFAQFKPVKRLPDSAPEPMVRFLWEQDVKGQYPVPDLNYLAYFGRGLDKSQAEKIQSSELALIIDIAYPKNNAIGGLKASSSALFKYAQANDGFIWDSETRELYTPNAWETKRVQGWAGNVPEVDKHTVIHAYDTGKGIRAITLGMAKFGVPDVVVNNFSWSLNEPMGNLVNLVAQSLVEGITPDNDAVLELNIDVLQTTQFKKQLKQSLIENAQPKVKIRIAAGVWEQGDPNNALLELVFSDDKQSATSEQQQALLSSVFGLEENIAYVKHNQLINEASERARQKLKGLKKAFNEGLAPGEFILLKAPFTTPEGGNEWMWVEVLSWKEKVIKGLLKNEPYHIPNLRAGSEVEVQQDDIFDYIRTYPDGKAEGNETGELIQKYQQ